MKAGTIIKKDEICISEFPLPQINFPNQVLLKIKMVGICGSDVHIFKGENPFATYPRVFGHEFTGEVAAVGEAVTKVAVGDHVVGEPIEYCGECYACQKGRGNVCSSLKVMGVHMHGGCQEYLVMDESKVHKIDPQIPWSTAVLTEPMTIGFQATSRGGVEAGDVVLIMGSGTIGLCCLMAAKAKGVVCICTDILPEKLEYARKMGADHTINALEEDVDQRVLAITQGMGPNVVLDGVCNKRSLEQAIDLVSPAGRVVELGFGPVKSEVAHVTMMKKEVSLMGTRLQAAKFPEAVDYVQTHAQQLAEMVTQRYSVEQVEEAFAYALNNPKKVRKIVVEF